MACGFSYASSAYTQNGVSGDADADAADAGDDDDDDDDDAAGSAFVEKTFGGRTSSLCWQQRHASTVLARSGWLPMRTQTPCGDSAKASLLSVVSGTSRKASVREISMPNRDIGFKERVDEVEGDPAATAAAASVATGANARRGRSALCMSTAAGGKILTMEGMIM